MSEMYNRKNAWESLSLEERDKAFEYSKEYMHFLNTSKTEREVVKNVIRMAENAGFRDLNSLETVVAGDKVYFNNKDKNIFLAVVGKQGLENGINIIGSHADSPRLDLRQNPLSKEDDLDFFKTQYYGGIKRYQWTTIPLSMHGVIINKKGEKIEVCLGEKEEDPVFVITDLLPHLAKEQMKKNLSEGITGEDLQVLIGNSKEKIEDILLKEYHMEKEDFITSEIELVPAFKARTVGLDGSLVGGYGQDDKSCVFTSVTAILGLNEVEKTAVCLVADKEEIGSIGNTGMESAVFDYFMTELRDKMGDTTKLNKIYYNSKMLSADVDAGYDPIYKSVYDKENSALLGNGVEITKYTGGRGKSGGSDANAEYLHYVRNKFEENNVLYQTGELGKVDAGGGGTIAYIFANKGVEVLDCGVAVLSMHAPYEICSKLDIYMMNKACIAFWK